MRGQMECGRVWGTWRDAVVCTPRTLLRRVLTPHAHHGQGSAPLFMVWVLKIQGPAKAQRVRGAQVHAVAHSTALNTSLPGTKSQTQKRLLVLTQYFIFSFKKTMVSNVSAQVRGVRSSTRARRISAARNPTFPLIDTTTHGNIAWCLGVCKESSLVYSS